MISFAFLWLLSTITAMLTSHLMSAWLLVTVSALYGSVTLYGWLYWNAKAGEWAFKKQEGE